MTAIPGFARRPRGRWGRSPTAKHCSSWSICWETRIKVVKAAAAIGDPRFLEPFHHALEDPQWEVRCQAARGLSVLGSPRSVPRLSRALCDPQWWVRFYAGVALAEVGAVGKAALTD